ncbi:MAG TPA: signal recognition particle protein [Alphaproteobacteria bacterium]|nr:signal recognition particle protein [Alphaproteobacteria bacterium]
MFEQLSGKLSAVFDKLSAKGLLTETDINNCLREIRIALLQADVALPVIKEFLEKVKEKALQESVLKAIKPSEQVIKVVHDSLVETLGQGEELDLTCQPPAVILMAGLQGSGKTSTTAKIAKVLKEKRNKKVLLVSLDIYRPAAQEQLQTLANSIDVGFYGLTNGEDPRKTAKKAMEMAKKQAYDIVMLDTAGRLEIDDNLMTELKDVKEIANPIETLLVVDSLTGQVAAKVAQSFKDSIGLTGLVLTRIDGDGRAGAVLSVKGITQVPVKYLTTGETVDAIQEFDPSRIANRILQMGDIVELVEKAQAAFENEDAEEMMKSMSKGRFTLVDLKKQLEMVGKMGSMSSLMKMMPGMGKLASKIDPAKMDDKVIKHQIAIINSMTLKERLNPDIIKAKRKIRIAKGSGLTVNDVNKLLKSHKQMSVMMKKFKGGMPGLGGLGGKMTKSQQNQMMNQMKNFKI